LRTIDWDDGAIVMVDQTALPDRLVTLRIEAVEDLVAAIGRLAVRGAPALEAAGALGVALAARGERDPGRVRALAARLAAARPTAVNLERGVRRALARLDDGPDAVRDEALALLAEDEARNRAIGRRGAAFLADLGLERPRVLTHCNTGALATVGWGTALGIVRWLHAAGRLGMVYATETRPLLQGSRLTAWELEDMGAEYRLVVDGAAAAIVARGLVDVVLVGADRIAANGDVANKIGTYALALAAARHGIPMVVAAPESTIDPATSAGTAIAIEVRPDAEVLRCGGVSVAPRGAAALNLAFDVTPADLVTALVTERRVLRPAAGERPVPGEDPR